MTIYIDKLPEDCLDCPCENEDYCDLLNEGIGCKFGEKHKDCPLKTIAEHDKQVKKELLDKLCNMLTDRAELIKTGDVAEFMFTIYDLKESIKQIQGE